MAGLVDAHLVDAPSSCQVLMEDVSLHVPAGQGLIVQEDHGVVFGVRLVAALFDPVQAFGGLCNISIGAEKRLEMSNV